MKKNYMKLVWSFSLILFLSSPMLAADHQKGDPEKVKALNMKNKGPVKTPSMLVFGSDVVINPAFQMQSNVKIATAFNGWNYAAFTTDYANGGGICLMRSKNHGQDWDTLIHYSGDYYGCDISVAGNDTNSLHVYLTSVLHTPLSGTYILWVDRNDATTGSFMNEPVHETTSDSIYDVALANDFLHPAFTTTGYSVNAVYSKYGSPQDSVISLVSSDGGATFATRNGVDASSLFFRNVSVAYGYSASRNNGRYFIAYDEHAFGAPYGHIKETYTPTLFNDPYATPVYLDSVYTSNWYNNGRYPAISVQNSLANNDSSDLSAVVLWESAWGGTDDLDIVGAYSKIAVGGAWYYGYVDYSGNHAQQPDISYDETYNNFLVTYWDSTNNQLPYYVQGFNMATPTSWNMITTLYNDQVGILNNPHPQVVIDPSFTMADFAWIETRGPFSLSLALFDAENSFMGVQEHHQHKFTLDQNYPNPANESTIISFELVKPDHVTLEVFDLVGNKMATLENNNLSAGAHQFKMDVTQIPAGYYMYALRAGDDQLTKKLLVVH
ncbi:MAG: T9SS type A sorting domain-containing protein [Bacteroidetes bacterium]|nr:T9SS type A sorting domain-containing protein [Bacteroidota bacterium]